MCLFASFVAIEFIRLFVCLSVALPLSLTVSNRLLYLTNICPSINVRSYKCVCDFIWIYHIPSVVLYPCSLYVLCLSTKTCLSFCHPFVYTYMDWVHLKLMYWWKISNCPCVWFCHSFNHLCADRRSPWYFYTHAHTSLHISYLFDSLNHYAVPRTFPLSNLDAHHENWGFNPAWPTFPACPRLAWNWRSDRWRKTWRW